MNNSTTSPLLHIRNETGWRFINFKELIEYRDLFYFLVLRDIKVKYKQTVLGASWAIIQPFFTMVVFSLFFGRLAKIPSDGIPYPIFTFTALVAWTYFSSSISGSGNSLTGNAPLITKVYFPKLIIPLARIFAGLLDFTIAFIVLILMMIFYNIYPSFNLMYIPFLVLLMILTSSGFGLIFASLNAKYRDIKFALPFFIQLWMFASPIVYPSSMIPDKYKLLYSLNPMVGIIEGFRSILLGKIEFPTSMIIISTIVSIILFILGLMYFKQTERFFADIV